MEESDMILSKILEHYGRDTLDEFRNEDPIKNRDLVLDALSDSGTVAPLVRTAKLHAKANPKSYMYVFSHPRAMQDYSGVFYYFINKYIYFFQFNLFNSLNFYSNNDREQFTVKSYHIFLVFHLMVVNIIFVVDTTLGKHYSLRQ